MRADLHTHSIYSDGLYSPDEICRKAKMRGLSLVSITDHDTLAGEEVKREAAKRHGLLYVTGWEISAYEGDQKIHILGYGCELNDAYRSFMAERKRGARLRAEDSVQKLQRLGVPVTMEEVYMQDAGLHFLVRVDTALPDRDLTEKLLSAGIRVRTLSSYYHDDAHRDSHCLVVNYSGLREERLEEIPKRLAGVFG